jgi:hypothetical protein
MDDNSPTKTPWYALAAAVVVVVAFVWLCIAMIHAAKTASSTEWDHLVVVFNSVQTMAAAALGVLLGTSVQQAKVDAARSRAVAAETRRDVAEEKALKADAARKIVTEALDGEQHGHEATLRAVAATLK